MKLTFEQTVAKIASYPGVGRHDHKFILYSLQEGHELLLNTCNKRGVLAIEMDKLHGSY